MVLYLFYIKTWYAIGHKASTFIYYFCNHDGFHFSISQLHNVMKIYSIFPKSIPLLSIRVFFLLTIIFTAKIKETCAISSPKIVFKKEPSVLTTPDNPSKSEQGCHHKFLVNHCRKKIRKKNLIKLQQLRKQKLILRQQKRLKRNIKYKARQNKLLSFKE